MVIIPNFRVKNLTSVIFVEISTVLLYHNTNKNRHGGFNMNSYIEKDFELLKAADAELFEALDLEFTRQSRNIELIASENYTSAAVMAASGSILTNKYAEGYPSRRYYGGCKSFSNINIFATTVISA